MEIPKTVDEVVTISDSDDELQSSEKIGALNGNADDMEEEEE